MKNHCNRKKNAEAINDSEFERWISDRVLEETAEMIKGMENDPDLDKFKPTQELYDRILKEARERGLLDEDDVDDNEEDD